MAEPTLGDVMAELAAIRALGTKIELEQRQQTALLTAIIRGQQLMALDIKTLTDALTLLNTATSQEATLLIAQNGKLDAVQATINSIIATPGIPQAVLDQVAQVQATIASMQATTVEQASRLDQMAVDPRNAVPIAPPVSAPPATT